MKPNETLVDALLHLTNADDIVLDPFLGSGSTLIAAHAFKRVCRGVEIDPLYVDVTVRREDVSGEAAILVSAYATSVLCAATRTAPGGE